MSTPSAAGSTGVLLHTLQHLRQRDEKIAALTCYDASFAALLDHCGVDVLLVGDSLGMVVGGHSSTLPVTIDQMVYHTACVARGAQRPWIVADLPFGSYQSSPQQAYDNAARLLAAGAPMVQLEGGDWLVPTVEFLSARDIPVCGHLGLTPQSVHALGGYRVQAKTDEAAQALEKTALALQNAGARLLVLEAIPSQVGHDVTAALTIPTIGIGAGPNCSGQVLVLHDMLAIFPGKKARFVRNFMQNASSIENAITRYIQDVKSGAFPAAEHCF
ncbi:MAG: 3-methyl-2-oxobutanoate hydroxymethyltransferase [Burkholderiaceae bacterium]